MWRQCSRERATFGHTVRITAQLDNRDRLPYLVPDYDRDLQDVLKLQTEIATAVAGSLKVTSSGMWRRRSSWRDTHPARLMRFCGAGRQLRSRNSGRDRAYTEAIRLDPNYALALANDRSHSLTLPRRHRDRTFVKASISGVGCTQRASTRARSGRRHLALAYTFEAGLLDFPGRIKSTSGRLRSHRAMRGVARLRHLRRPHGAHRGASPPRGVRSC